jgi:hypothetical protein
MGGIQCEGVVATFVGNVEGRPRILSKELPKRVAGEKPEEKRTKMNVGWSERGLSQGTV